jgi:hypothetical protein
MVNYQNAKLYKLVGSGLTYYGSTCNELRKRLNQHKNKNNECKSKLLFDSGDKVEIILVEKYPCNDKMELQQRERYYIENFECVNQVIPLRNKKEYYETNKDKINEKRKEYYEVNKDKKKQYYKDNIDKIKEQKSEKITCECGLISTRNKLSRHKQSKKHIIFINKKNNII